MDIILFFNIIVCSIDSNTMDVGDVDDCLRISNVDSSTVVHDYDMKEYRDLSDNHLFRVPVSPFIKDNDYFLNFDNIHDIKENSIEDSYVSFEKMLNELNRKINNVKQEIKELNDTNAFKNKFDECFGADIESFRRQWKSMLTNNIKIKNMFDSEDEICLICDMIVDVVICYDICNSIAFDRMLREMILLYCDFNKKLVKKYKKKSKEIIDPLKPLLNKLFRPADLIIKDEIKDLNKKYLYQRVISIIMDCFVIRNHRIQDGIQPSTSSENNAEDNILFEFMKETYILSKYRDRLKKINKSEILKRLNRYMINDDYISIMDVGIFEYLYLGNAKLDNLLRIVEDYSCEYVDIFYENYNYKIDYKSIQELKDYICDNLMDCLHRIQEFLFNTNTQTGILVMV